MSRHGHKIEIDSNGFGKCPESGLVYKLNSKDKLQCDTIDELDPLPVKMSKGVKKYREFKAKI